MIMVVLRVLNGCITCAEWLYGMVVQNNGCIICAIARIKFGGFIKRSAVQVHAYLEYLFLQ